MFNIFKKVKELEEKVKKLEERDDFVLTSDTNKIILKKFTFKIIYNIPSYLSTLDRENIYFYLENSPNYDEIYITAKDEYIYYSQGHFIKNPNPILKKK